MDNSHSTQAAPSPQRSVVPAGATVIDLLRKESFQAEIAKALPGFLKPEAFLRVALTAVRKNEVLLKADGTSLLSAVMDAAQVGLVLDSVLGHGYLLPFWSSKRNAFLVQFIPGYRGLMELARRGGGVAKIEPRVVHEGDEFTYRYGLNPVLEHVPCSESERGAMAYVYAIAYLRDGTSPQFDVMSSGDVDLIRARSPSVKKGTPSPWDTDYEAMALKTVIRRLCKYLPISVEAQRVISRDEAFEAARDVEAEIHEPLRATKIDDIRPRATEPRAAGEAAGSEAHSEEPAQDGSAEHEPEPDPTPPQTKPRGPRSTKAAAPASAPGDFREPLSKEQRERFELLISKGYTKPEDLAKLYALFGASEVGTLAKDDAATILSGLSDGSIWERLQ